MMSRICKSVEERGNKLHYCVIYLAPQDYHRFHSPAHACFAYRRHIAGYLESVMPAYLNYRKEVLKNNECVNLLGEWQNGFFALSFIGAMNVGSIAVHFDDMLKTNHYDPTPPYLSDRNYTLVGQDMKQTDNKYMKVPVSVAKNEQPIDLAPYLSEFDIKDIGTDVAYRYKP